MQILKEMKFKVRVRVLHQTQTVSRSVSLLELLLTISLQDCGAKGQSLPELIISAIGNHPGVLLLWNI